MVATAPLLQRIFRKLKPRQGKRWPPRPTKAALKEFMTRTPATDINICPPGSTDPSLAVRNSMFFNKLPPELHLQICVLAFGNGVVHVEDDGTDRLSRTAYFCPYALDWRLPRENDCGDVGALTVSSSEMTAMRQQKRSSFFSSELIVWRGNCSRPPSRLEMFEIAVRNATFQSLVSAQRKQQTTVVQKSPRHQHAGRFWRSLGNVDVEVDGAIAVGQIDTKELGGERCDVRGRIANSGWPMKRHLDNSIPTSMEPLEVPAEEHGEFGIKLNNDNPLPLACAAPAADHWILGLPVRADGLQGWAGIFRLETPMSGHSNGLYRVEAVKDKMPRTNGVHSLGRGATGLFQDLSRG
ncbi:uncharacterized protein PADG_08222 [Paracoccidioides brasiliensis Pb18]|uniref:Uncharacterized protein n=1 Tax=Paracoccidioides brasiliensis (strain Pb18) TaxID=502780 RepID=C1GMD6_PARBD|nr:uncharacterized protein PADG_08222 [Paracoccidioides brasiliensis Pb18]EEH43602.2 hypothetical protein PADG_08222 [Paracoccidioides brasiliensis Pb18]